MPDVFETEVKLRFKVPAGEVDRIKKVVESALSTTSIGRLKGMAPLLGGAGAAGKGKGPEGFMAFAGIGGGGGIGAMLGKLGIIAAIANQVIELLQKAVAFLAQSSPALRSVMYQFQKAIMIFFRPFGDFLATMLRPLSRSLLKMSRDWLKWTRKPLGEKLEDVLKSLPKFFTFPGAALNIVDLLTGQKINIWEFITTGTKNIWDWITGKAKPIWDWISTTTRDIFFWVTEKSRDIFYWITDTARNIFYWITDFSRNIFFWITDFSRSIFYWVTDTARSIFFWITNVTKSIWDWITGTAKSVWTWITTSVKSVWDWISTPIKSIWDFITGWKPWWQGQAGGVVPGPIGAAVPALLHGGETVLPTHKYPATAGNVINLGGIKIVVDRVSSAYDISRIADDLSDRIIDNLRTRI